MTSLDRSTAASAQFDVKQAARIVGLPASRLRQCVRSGLVDAHRDGRGRLTFDFIDLVLLRTTRGLLTQRVPLRKIGVGSPGTELEFAL